MKVASCHPNRKHKAKGMCGACYEKHLRDTNPTYKAKVDTYYQQWKVGKEDRLKEYYRTRWQQRKADPEHQAKARDRRLRLEYGITQQQYLEMLDDQGGGCKLCGRRPGRIPLHVDHDHVSGRVRGILCHQCNWFLGTIDADPQILDKITEYRRDANDESA